MLRLAAIAVIGALSVAAAGVAGQAVVAFNNHADRDSPLRPAESAAPVAAVAEAPAEGSAASVVKAADGHYWAEAEVDGHEVRFLVDTGASAVSLTPDDAQRLGFSPASLAYTYQVNTAGGVARAAKIKLDSVSVAGAVVNNVDAYVIESGLPTSLLGMTYLGRLSQFEATQTALILRP
jgi:aspartyl protease family protein